MLRWDVSEGDGWRLAKFLIEDSPLDVSALAEIALPGELAGRTDQGLILSGRGPVWLFAHLTHLAHPYAWVATFDSHLGVGVVVQSHTPDGPGVGDRIAVPPAVKSKHTVHADPHLDPEDQGEVSGGRQSTEATSEQWLDEVRLRRLRPARWISVQLLLFPTLALVVLIAAHWIAYALWEAVHGWGLLVAPAGLILFCTLVLILYRVRHEHRNRGLLALSAAAVVLGDMLAMAFHEWVHPSGMWAVVVGVLLGVVLLASMTQLHHMRKTFFGVRSLQRFSWSPEDRRWDAGDAAARPRVRHLILPLSAPDRRPGFDENGAFFLDTESPDGRVVLAGEKLGGEEGDIAAMSRLGHPKWQQVLRAIEPHVGSLEAVWLIGSDGDAAGLTATELDRVVRPGGRVQEPDKPGSAAFMGDAARLLHPYLEKPAARIHCCRAEQSADKFCFTDPETLRDWVQALIARIRQEDPSVKETEILIDTTGGQKPVSIVGAMSTLNSEAMFQYVDTAPPHIVHLFDHRVDRPPEMH